MNTIHQNPSEILDRNIPGFHQYCLSGPVGPVFVSRNLCNMLQMPKEALLCPQEDRYAQAVHPADREAYQAFLQELGAGPGTLTMQYRLVSASGRVIFVSDTMTAYRQGRHLMADSVLTDITRLKSENQNLQYLNDTIPCGFVRYTCEKNPRVTYLNDRMLKILGLSGKPDGEFDDLGLYMNSIYTMIPADERQRFARYLERVSEQGAPVAGEMTALRCDGTRIRIFGWVTKCVNEEGQEEFQSAFMDITERYHQQKARETSRHLQALAEVYDKIFEFDLAANTVKCLYGQKSPTFQWLENIPMQMGEATERWITGSAAEEDKARLRSFFRELNQGSHAASDGRPPQITYRALSSAGNFQTYTGIFLRMDDHTSLYCCRQAPDALESAGMQELAMRFTEGVVAFEIEHDTVKPMYISENVCSFFGYSRDAWLTLAQNRPTIQEFIAQSGIGYADVKKLFAEGEAAFTYFDMAQNAYRRIRAICSGNYHTDGKCYVMLYNLDSKVEEAPPVRVSIRTFGYFDVFVNDVPIAFRNEKSRELLALLVERRGGFVSSEEAISFLWEEEAANPVTLARYRKVALRLKNILEEYGISDIVESVNGKRRIVAEKVRCDLFDYLAGQTELFKGSYLTNYSWSEMTLGALTGDYLAADR